MANQRGHWWSWYNPPEPDKPLPEWLLDIAGGDDPTSAARPWFLIKTDRDLKDWPDQRWIKNERYYRTFNEDGRMVQMLAFDETLVRRNGAWSTAFPHVLETPEQEVRIKMVEPRRMSFLGGVLTLTGDKWRAEGDPLPTAFDGDFLGKDVIIVAPEFGVEPPGYARVGFVGMGKGSPYHGNKPLPPGVSWWQIPSTTNLCLRHDVIARAVARFRPELRCAIVCSSFGTKLEPVTAKLTDAPKMMMASEEIVVSAKSESPPPSEESVARFLA